MPFRTREKNLRSIAHPNQKHGTVVQYKNSLGNEPIAPPTDGQVLTGQADGTWAAETPTPVPDSFVSIKETEFTSGTTTFTPDAKCMYAVVRGVGGGGGGGGSDPDASFTQGGGGGGGGGYCEETYAVASLTPSQSVVIGAAGSAGSSSGGNGGDGGNTTFGSLFTASGGTGGTGTGADLAAVAVFAGGAGGAASGGRINIPGQAGKQGDGNYGGDGGSSPFGWGGRGTSPDAAGAAGTGKGAGGAGACDDDSGGGNSGGAGTIGYLIVTEYLHA